MAKKKLTPEQEKEIKYLQANNEMLENTKEEAKLRGTESAVKRIELAQQDVIEQVRKIDPTLAKKMEKKDKTESFAVNMINNLGKEKNDSETIFDALKKANEEISSTNDSEKTINDEIEENNVVINKETDFNDIDTDAQYDVISLPSNGECYRDKLTRIPVGYLTAYDENFITSPNLYKDGLIIDFLLKNKVLNKNINVDELCSGDVDAIILFLRATSYGVDFPIVVRDPDSGEQIETSVDLSTLKYKEFNLKGDENGHFEFILPLSKDIIKFKFLTRKEEKQLSILGSLENNRVKANTILNSMDFITDAIKTDKKLQGKEKQELINYLGHINVWAKEIAKDNSEPITKTITNRLEMSIVSINGNEDRVFISKYVKNMNARDSLSLRRYMIDNEPGVNFEIEVQRPESLGGGSFKTFLEWDDSIFLNI